MRTLYIAKVRYYLDLILVLVPILVLFALIPVTSALVDCRVACKSCRANKVVPSLLEVYCSMCEECKSRRQRHVNVTSANITTTIQTTKAKKTVNITTIAPTTVAKEKPKLDINISNDISESQLPTIHQSQLRQYTNSEPERYDLLNNGRLSNKLGWNAQRFGDSYEYDAPREHNSMRKQNMPEIPEGCPTPPPCIEDPEPLVGSPPTTTTTTTTTRKPCPPVRPCRKRPRPCYQPCMMPMCPCYPYSYPRHTSTTDSYDTYETETRRRPKVISLQHDDDDNKQMLHGATQPGVKMRSSTSKDFMYMYVGIPKNILKESSLV